MTYTMLSREHSIRRAGRRGAHISSLFLAGEIANVWLKIAGLNAVERVNNLAMAGFKKLDPENQDVRRFVLARRKSLEVASTVRMEKLFALAQVLKSLKWERRIIARLLSMTVKSCDLNRTLMPEEFKAQASAGDVLMDAYRHEYGADEGAYTRS